jgi:hypothetical protein
VLSMVVATRRRPRCGLALRIAAETPQDEVHLELHKGVFAVPVVINGAISIPFVLDSGAADVQLGQHFMA